MSRDLIDRQTVIDALDHIIKNGAKSRYSLEHPISAECMREYIMSLPFAQPDLQPTCNQLAKDINVPCKDTISRQDGRMTNREYLNSLSDDDFAEWLCKQLWDGFEPGKRFVDLMRFNEVRNFLKGEYKEEPE